jgi:hypothetical protein
MNISKIILLLLSIIILPNTIAVDIENANCDEKSRLGPIEYSDKPFPSRAFRPLVNAPKVNDEDFNIMLELTRSLPLHISEKELFERVGRPPDRIFRTIEHAPKYTWYYGDINIVAVQMWHGCISRVSFVWEKGDKFYAVVRKNEMAP